MRKDFGKKTWLFPMPVLVLGTYDENGNANAMTAAWGGIYDTDQIFICLSSDHLTTKNIHLKKEFTAAFATKDTIEKADYVGIVSGNEVDKLSKCDLKHAKAKFVDAPIFDDFPMALECKVVKLDDDGQTAYLVADIVNVSADEKILNEKGLPDSEKLQAVSYNSVNHTYELVGGKVANAFSSGNKYK